MIADLKSFLDGFGTVVKVEIFEDRQVPSFHCDLLKIDWETQWSWKSSLQVPFLSAKGLI